MSAQSTIPVQAVPSSVEGFFQWSLFGLVTCGFAALASTGQLDFATFVLVTGALLIRAVLMERGVQWAISDRYSSGLALLYVIAFFTDLLLISRSYVAATVHLVLFATVVKLFSVKRERDHLYLAVLAFLEVLAASVLTVDSAFLAAFTVFLLFAVATFLSMEVRRAFLRQYQPQRSVRIAAFPRKSLLRVSIALVVAIILAGSGLFFLLPRKTGGYMNALARSNDLVSGFSDSVDLGAIGAIQQSNQIVMHVTVLSEAVPMENLHWRGVTLGTFNGRRWSNLPDYATPLQLSPDGRFNLQKTLGEWDTNATRIATGDVSRPFRYHVSLEPIGTDVIFLPAEAQSLDADFRSIDGDFGRSVFVRDHSRSYAEYAGVSDLSRASARELGAAGEFYPLQVRERYLQLPPINSRIYDLAKEITSKADNNFQRAAAIENYLRTSFRYTLQLPSRESKDPLANFLFVRHEGHCEYFASSMAVMLRTIGIPSRIVNGFRGSEYNDLTGNYIIRAKNAHSWVEAYFPGYGWMEFDPTPPSDEVAGTTFSRMALYLDAARQFWRDWVVDYDFLRQRQLGSIAASHGRHWVEDAAGWAQEKYRSLVRTAQAWTDWVANSGRAGARAALAGAGVALLLAGVPFALSAMKRRRVLANAATTPSDAAAFWYSRMLKTVARRGWRKSPAQTPGEFALSIQDSRLQASVVTFTDCYERARYGESGEDALQLPDRFEEVEALQRGS